MQLVIPLNKHSNQFYSYQGAQNSRHRDYGNPPAASKTEDEVLTASDRNKITARLYDLYRNNEICAAITDSYVSAIGDVQFRATENIIVEDYFFDWLENLELNGEDLSSLIRQVTIQLLFAGDVFISLLKTGEVQVIEASQIYSDRKTALPNEVQGVVRDANLRITGYRLQGETILPIKTCKHIFRKDRASSVRGIPWLASALPALQDIAELMGAKMLATKNHAMTIGVKKSNDVHQDGYDSPAQSNIKSGTILEIGNDEEFDLLSAETNSDDFNAYLRERIRHVCSVLGLPYEMVYGFNLSNFSSSKATRSIFVNKIKNLRKFFVKKLLNPLFEWKAEKAHREEGLPLIDLHAWNWSNVPQLDAEREVKTAVMALKNKITTRARIAAELHGSYWEEELEQLYQEAALEKKLQAKYNVNPDLIEKFPSNNDK